MVPTADQATMDAAPDLIMQIATGFMAAKHLFVANEIGLFEHLAGGPATLDELAARSGVPRRTVRILADAMATLGLVEQREAQYQNSPAAATLLSGHGPSDLRPVLRFWDHISYPAWLTLEQAVRSGQAQTRRGYFSAKEQRIFSAAVEALTAGTAQALATTYDFGRHRRVLDLAVASGPFSAPYCASTASCTAPCSICPQSPPSRGSAWPRTRPRARLTWWQATSSRIRFPTATTPLSWRTWCTCSLQSATACCCTHARARP